jgi:hypothetical protein
LRSHQHVSLCYGRAISHRARRSRLIVARKTFRNVRPAGRIRSCEGVNVQSSGDRMNPAESSQGYSQLSGRSPSRSTAGFRTSISLARWLTCRITPAIPLALGRISKIYALITTGSTLATYAWLVRRASGEVLVEIRWALQSFSQAICRNNNLWHGAATAYGYFSYNSQALKSTSA